MTNKRGKLINILLDIERTLIAYSGGVDSAFLLGVARDTLGKSNVLAVTAVSASLPKREKWEAQAITRELDAEHIFIETNEMKDRQYTSNPINRCFYCKSELFNQIGPLALERNMTIVDGFNASDRSDFRPGHAAAQSFGVRHPLEEADLTKNEIRQLAQQSQYQFWNKPASPCLSSRFPQGLEITEEALGKVDRAEEIIKELGFRIVRVRHLGQLARIEVGRDEINRAKKLFDTILQKMIHIGYKNISLDPNGYRQGSLSRIHP